MQKQNKNNIKIGITETVYKVKKNYYFQLWFLQK